MFVIKRTTKKPLCCKKDYFYQNFKKNPLKQVTIKNNFIELSALNFGAIIQKIIVKNKKGEDTNVVVGFNNPEDYVSKDAGRFLGACVGRYAGRISNNGFSIDNTNYPLKSVDGVHLHGGEETFGKKYWELAEVNHGDTPFVKFSYTSKDLEGGYPGNVTAMVTYKLVGKSLEIIHEATTDKTTIINLTNHSYFVLDDASNVNEYDLELNCNQILDTLNNLLPTGKLTPVTNTKYDFLTRKQLKETRLDTSFVINSAKKENTAATVFSKKSGISLEVNTNQPAMVIYTPVDFAGICFETQNYPDAPNHSNFPSSVLEPGETYNNTSTFTFDVL